MKNSKVTLLYSLDADDTVSLAKFQRPRMSSGAVSTTLLTVEGAETDQNGNTTSRSDRPTTKKGSTEKASTTSDGKNGKPAPKKSRACVLL